MNWLIRTFTSGMVTGVDRFWIVWACTIAKRVTWGQSTGFSGGTVVIVVIVVIVCLMPLDIWTNEIVVEFMLVCVHGLLLDVCVVRLYVLL